MKRARATVERLCFPPSTEGRKTASRAQLQRYRAGGDVIQLGLASSRHGHGVPKRGQQHESFLSVPDRAPNKQHAGPLDHTSSMEDTTDRRYAVEPRYQNQVGY